MGIITEHTILKAGRGDTGWGDKGVVDAYEWGLQPGPPQTCEGSVTEGRGLRTRM